MKKKVELPRSKKLLLFLLSLVIFAAVVIPSLFAARTKISRIVENTVTTIVHNDSREWENVVHPNCDKEISQLSILIKSLEASGIDLLEKPEQITIDSFHELITRWEKKLTIEATVVIGGVPHRLSLLYLENEFGKGVQSLSFDSP